MDGNQILLKARQSQWWEGERKEKEGGEKKTHEYLLMNLWQANSILRQVFSKTFQSQLLREFLQGSQAVSWGPG